MHSSVVSNTKLKYFLNFMRLQRVVLYYKNSNLPFTGRQGLHSLKKSLNLEFHFSLKSPKISVQVLEKSLNFLNFECSSLERVS